MWHSPSVSHNGRLPGGLRGEPAGAIVGGCLEYDALLTCYDNLLIVTAAMYLIAFSLLPKSARSSWRSSALT